MNREHGHLFMAFYICVAIVGILVVAKYWQDGPVNAQPDSDSGLIEESQAIDQDFFEQESGTGDRSTATTTTASKPAQTISRPRAYLVGNLETGEVYMSHNASTVLPVASMSKLITAFAITDSVPLDYMVTITDQETMVASDTSRLMSGEKFTVKELLYPLLLNSSNVAAEALASSSDRIKFLELMSSYAWEVGMSSSFFADPSGLSEQNQSTAADFFELAKYIYKSRPDILAITRLGEVLSATTTDHGSHVFVSTHPFIADRDFLGGKTGRTPEAGETMLTILKVNSEPIAFIILGSQFGSREADTKRLINEFMSKRSSL